MEEITGTLENWEVIGNTYGNFQMCGNLFNDIKKRWRDGEIIYTSRILEPLEDFKEGDIITTRNSKYLLGKPFIKVNN